MSPESSFKSHVTLTAQLLFAAKWFGEQPVLKFEVDTDQKFRTISYRELGENSRKMAASLQVLGLREGEAVALIGKPSPEWAYAFYGILLAKGIVVPIDPATSAPELNRYLKATEAKAVIAEESCLKVIEGQSAMKFTVSLANESDQPTIGKMLSQTGSGFVEQEIKSTDLALRMPTSGTTASSKPVNLNHRNLVSNIYNGLQVIQMNTNDRVITVGPWYHTMGLYALNAALWRGFCLTYTTNYLDILNLVSRLKATIVLGMPKLFHAFYERIERNIAASFWKRLLNRLTPRLLGWFIKRKRKLGKQFRFLVSGSAALDPRVKRGFRRWGIGLRDGYGLTEASPAVTVSDPFDKKYASVGKAIPHVWLKILNPNKDGVGELLVEAPSVMVGYHNNPEATAAAIDSQGQLHTGDLARIDKDGNVFIHGRVRDFFVLSTGKNIYPEEVEFELQRILHTDDVLIRGVKEGANIVIEALVYPNEELYKNSKSNRAIADFIADEIRQHGKKVLSSWKLPKRVVILDKPIERTPTLKPKRHLYQQEVI